MRYGDRRQSRPFDAWDPYRDDPAPRPRRRYEPRRLIRIAIPLLIGGAALGRDLWHAFGPDRAPAQQAVSVPEPTAPALTADRSERPDPRTALPRRAQPADNPGDWITPDDYPPSALRENLQGSVAFRFTIKPDGHVRDCTVTHGSGSALLDETACGIFTLHARYWPARDRAGKPISEVQNQTVRWQIPKD
ncbi:energy transducer TonB [Sphingomonas oryzagri]|uniref:TonB family protein n=1 Tax=Sphingomonas oryzagri TaxID=3042314 RepID=A0ABT6N760_9SPHN|nr:energy transducer TonB [Sphingomonas oryzagri]MDH7640930.1 TonB family protein [Sphingomonas oryzagri]